ncbi:MAG: DUF5011 domain-containing protein [Planctomycetes bacterium]|nr:DUF5011 domain-containing protein [Planctomycetota bacterium]
MDSQHAASRTPVRQNLFQLVKGALSAALLCAAIPAASANDTVPPVITLNGSEVMTLNGGQFVDPGATAFDDVDGDISDRILVWGSVDSQIEGIYEIFYQVSDASGNNAFTLRRIVVVDGIAPEVRVLGDNPMVVAWKESFVDPGVSALDTFDGDVTASVRVDGSVDTQVLGRYDLTYSVSDRVGNVGYARRSVVVADVTAPVILLSGSDRMSVECHSSFVDAGAMAMDDHDGDISARVAVTGSVDADVCGTYVLDYMVADAAGNAGHAQRIVTVVDTTAPLLEASVAMRRLMSAKGQMVDVGLYLSASDGCGGVSIAVSVTQEEVVGSDADAMLITDADGAVSGLRLRTEDGSSHDGRVYMIIVTATDDHGNVATKHLVVSVPHGKGKKPIERADAHAQAVLSAGVALPHDSLAPSAPTSRG